MIKPPLKPVEIRRRPVRRDRVTVCIAAKCYEEKGMFIVTVSDTKLTTGHYSLDLATVKIRRIHKNWNVLIAGKFSQQGSLNGHLMSALAPYSAPTLSQVEAACSAAFIAENKRLAEESVLGKYGLTVDEFVKRRVDLGDVIYERVWSEIGRIRVGCELIVCGFDEITFHMS
jgi:hypothetical protein